LSFAAERHMGRTVMRGTVYPAGVEEHITRKKDRVGTWEILRLTACPRGLAARIGKARSRSR